MGSGEQLRPGRDAAPVPRRALADELPLRIPLDLAQGIASGFARRSARRSAPLSVGGTRPWVCATTSTPSRSGLVRDLRRADGAGVLARTSPRASPAGRPAGAGRRAIDHVPSPSRGGAGAVLVGARAAARGLRPWRRRDRSDRQPDGAEAHGGGGLRVGAPAGERHRRGAPRGDATGAARPRHAGHGPGRADPPPPRLSERSDTGADRDAHRRR